MNAAFKYILCTGFAVGGTLLLTSTEDSTNSGNNNSNAFRPKVPMGTEEQFEENTSIEEQFPYDPNNPWANPDQQWIIAALQELGVSEEWNNGGDRINEYQQTTGAIDQAWCASFVNWSLAQSGKTGTGSASALSFANYGTDAGGPVLGSIAVFNRGGGQGHVGYVVGVLPDGRIQVLGGNQGNKVSVKTFSTKNVVGYRLP